MAVASSRHLLPRQFSITEFDQICDTGIVGYDERLELVDGVIVRLYPRDAAHIWTVSRAIHALVWDDDTIISPLNPLEVGDLTVLRPDIALVWANTPHTRAPEPRDIPLIIEVAEHSQEYDRQTKAPLYARASIPEYWIVDLTSERIEVYSEPSDAGYRSVRLYVRGEQLAPAFAPGLVVDVDTIFGAHETEEDSEQPSAE